MRSFSLALPVKQVPGAFDVCGGERLAVMPFDALAQREGQLGAVLAPWTSSVARSGTIDCRLFCAHVLVVHDEIIEHPHHRPHRAARRLLEDRHARRAVEMVRS